MAIMTKLDRGLINTLTVDDLTRAIKNSVDRKGLKDEEARNLARRVMNFFGYGDRIIDNILEPEDRDAFYILEDYGLLTTEREETTLYDGREWRIHYWLFKKDKILELVNTSREKERVALMTSAEDVYRQMSDTLWINHGKLEEEEESE